MPTICIYLHSSYCSRVFIFSLEFYELNNRNNGRFSIAKKNLLHFKCGMDWIWLIKIIEELRSTTLSRKDDYMSLNMTKEEQTNNRMERTMKNDTPLCSVAVEKSLSYQASIGQNDFHFFHSLTAVNLNCCHIFWIRIRFQST